MSRRHVHAAFLAFVALRGPATAHADLLEYVRKADPGFAWTQQADESTEAGRLSSLELTSQVWRGIPWKHRLRIYEPVELRHPDAALLFITGGSTDSRPSPEDHAQGFALARLCGARVAVLPQVPNQPLLDGKTEDDLIAETFVNYLKSGEGDWPLLLPMVKSAVAAMTAVQQHGEKAGRPVAKFVVTGASKRGWTTWLTGAVDPRVIAIAPMVIPTLNMRAQSKHQLDAWGKYSEQIEDYTRRGLTEKFDTPDGGVLWKLVDPYSYRDRLTMPKLQINGTVDRYWTLDSMNVYWDDLKGPKYVVYLPNAGHNLKEHREYALQGIGGFFRHCVTGRPLPTLSWRHESRKDGTVRIDIESSPAPKAALLWSARSASQDFRESTWQAGPGELAPAASGAKATGTATAENGGYSAAFWDLTFEIDGLDYHLSSQIFLAGPKVGD